MPNIGITMFSLDMALSTVSELSNIFPFNVEKCLNQATHISVQNINLAEVYYQGVPAWYDKTNKRLYAANISGHYWAVDGMTLTYT